MAKTFEPGTAVEVKVVSTVGCGNTIPTIERIEKVARELGADLKLETVVVAEMDEARANRLLGSPTVQVNGLDLDRDMRGETDYGLS